MKIMTCRLPVINNKMITTIFLMETGEVGIKCSSFNRVKNDKKCFKDAIYAA